MIYSDFTLPLAVSKFGLSLDTATDLFSPVTPLAPSEFLQTTLAENEPLALDMRTEKARSELLIAPILLEVRRKHGGRINLFSGELFSVDSAAGLSGFCDFLFTHSPYRSVIQAPVLAIVEAKREDITNGYGQCVATMVAAQQFNRQQNEPITTVHGVVTNGETWRFLSLSSSDVKIDNTAYNLGRLDHLLGALWRATE